MIITCPKCATRYRTSPKAIGPNGRTVRCANCEVTWYVSSEADTLALDSLSLADNEAADIGPMSGIAEATSKKLGEATQTIETGTETLPQKNLPRNPIRGAHVNIRDRADRRRRLKYLRGVTFIWLVPVMIIALVVMATYQKRHDIVASYPKSATFFKSIGIDVSQIGLILTPPETRYAELDGSPVLLVSGGVKNISQQMQIVPLIGLTLHNSGGDVIASWFVELENPRLAPNSRVEFLSQFPNPPLDAVELKTRFSVENEAQLDELSPPIETPLNIIPGE